jgi:hypothetical protein
MTSARPILGGIFIAILFVGFIYAIVSPTVQPIRFPRLGLRWTGYTGGNVVDRFSLFKGIDVSEGVIFITINATVRFGSVDVVFSNAPDLACNVTFQRGTGNAELHTSYNEDTVEHGSLSLYGETGGLNVTLGRGFQYDGNVDVRIGSVIMDFGQYTNVSTIAVSIRYFGGVIMKVGSGTSMSKVDVNIGIGGLQLMTDANNLRSNSEITARINIGGYTMGIDVNVGNIGVSLNSTVDVGGLTITHPDFSGTSSTTACSVSTTGYESASKKLDIVATVGLGGGTLQKSSYFQFYP